MTTEPTVVEVTPAPTLPEVAKKRGWQALVQGVVIDVAVAVALLILASVDSITTKAGLTLFLVSLAKTVIIAIAQYVVRRYGDRSGYDAEGQPLPRRAA